MLKVALRNVHSGVERIREKEGGNYEKGAKNIGETIDKRRKSVKTIVVIHKSVKLGKENKAWFEDACLH